MSALRILPGLWLPAAFAQAPMPVVLEGDLVAGAGAVTRIDHVDIADDGAWVVEVGTDALNPDADAAVLGAAGVFLVEGQALASPAGATVGGFDSLILGRDGTLTSNLFLDGPGTGLDSGVYVDGGLVLQEGDVLVDPAVSTGTSFRGFFDVKRWEDGTLHVLATIDDPQLPSPLEQVYLERGPGAPFHVALVQGDVLPGETDPIALFGTQTHASATDGEGRYLFYVELDAAPAVNGSIWLRDGAGYSKIAQEGATSPIAGRTWASLASTRVAVDALGRTAYTGRLSGPTASDSLLVLDGQPFVQEGGSLSAIAPWSFTSFGTGPLCLARSGDLLWYGDWNDPNQDVDTGLFIGHELVVQEGVTTVGGVAIDSLVGGLHGYALSGNGRWVIFEATLANGDTGAFVLDRALGSVVPTCDPATANSSGLPGRLAATGRAAAGGFPLRLTATDLPTQQFGFFVTSPQTGNVPMLGGGQGVLCLGGNIGRFDAQIQSTGAAGYAEIGVDTLQMPVFPTVPIQSGETWTFQFWHRDVNPVQTSNLTDAVSVTF